VFWHIFNSPNQLNFKKYYAYTSGFNPTFQDPVNFEGLPISGLAGLYFQQSLIYGILRQIIRSLHGEQTVS
jgi:hypothetical protein